MNRHRLHRPAALVLAALFALGLTGCKEAALDGFNRLVETGGILQLTPDWDLTGHRIQGADSYTGSYRADYAAFTGTEKLFGGSSIDRDGGWEVTVQATLQPDAGSARLVWTNGSGETVVLLEDKGSWNGTLTFAPGTDLICLEGDGFTGQLTLEIT